MANFDLTHFNPGNQNEANFLASFIARHDQLRYFLAQLRATTDGQAAKHHLVIAPRGYGKTSLLRRIKIALRDEAEFSSRYLPLAFREEQHNVISLDVFWRNCLQALLEAREDEHADPAEIDALDRLWHTHAPRTGLKRDAQDGVPAYTAFADCCRKLGRRPVLLVDNLDALLAGLAQYQWGLRSVLQRPDGPVLIAAASRYPDSLSAADAAFHDFFRITTLPPLSDHEVMSCLSEIARMRGERGAPVRHMLETDPGRIGALNTMAGGNPRTLGVLYTVLEAHMSDDVLAQLSAMLDTFTGWYQARTEELPLQSRAVFDALALHWDPMMAADIAKVTGLEIQTVSSQLSRLEKGGYAEAVPLSKTRKTRNAYQVSERFFNIWYLMRNGPRRTKQAIRFLTVFLRSCFSRHELHAMAQDKLRSNGGRIESTLALAASIGDSRLRTRLLNTAESSIDQLSHADEMRAVLDELRKEGKPRRKQPAKKTGSRFEQLMRTAWELTRTQHFELAEAAYREAIALDKNDIRPWNDLGCLLQDHLARYEEAEAAFRQAIILNDKATYPWSNLGIVLHYHLARYEEAEAAYRQAITLNEKDAHPWANLGYLLQDRLGRYEDALLAYQQAIAIRPQGKYSAYWQTSIAYLCSFHLERRNEACEYAREAEPSLSPSGRHLLNAMLAWSEGGTDAARGGWSELHLAVTCGDDALWSHYVIEDLRRVLAYATVRGDGEAVRNWMIAADYPLQYASLYHAYCAVLDGEDHLLAINPEVRGMAEKIYRGLARMVTLFKREQAAGKRRG